MVCETENPSLREASCCSVDVVKGGAGLRLLGFVSTLLTVKVVPLQYSMKATVSSFVEKRSDNSAFSGTAFPFASFVSNVPVTL